MSDSTPTAKFPAASPATPEAADGPSRRLLIILISIGAALLLAIIILLVVLLGRGDGTPVAAPSDAPTLSASPTPTSSDTPSATPTAEQTEEAPAPPPAPEPEPAGPITSFTVDDKSVNCDGQSSVPISFSWNTTGVTLWFGVGTNNAKNAPYDTFPLVYDLDFNYQCGQSSGQQIYTITVEQSNGDLLSKTITITE
jgi:hypothetical protein